MYESNDFHIKGFPPRSSLESRIHDIQLPDQKGLKNAGAVAEVASWCPYLIHRSPSLGLIYLIPSFLWQALYQQYAPFLALGLVAIVVIYLKFFW